ncbi:hypothetical protein TrVE_jg3786, partial [Triparma verrucosa]
MIPLVKSLVLFVALLLITGSEAACPNSCSGHGSCGSENTCTCDWGWSTAPDCSLRVCPNATSWGSKPTATSVGHTAMECAGVGVCQHATGLCECPIGFTGQACERLACPKDCSNQGTCQTVRNAGFTYGRDVAAVGASNGDGKGPLYNNWDKDSTTMCVCDTGFTGPDCSMRICPKGDDPLTNGQNYRKIVIATGADSGGVMGGFFKFNFMGESVRFSANASNWTSTQCDTAIDGLLNVQESTCVRSGGTVVGVPNERFLLGANYTVTFQSFPTFPHENNVYNHNGNPNILDFSCDVSEVSGTATNPYCKIWDSQSTNVREYAECSNRGLCDHSTGQCTCVAGYTGVSCDTADGNVAAQVTSPISDVMLLYASSGNFAGNSLRLKTDRAANDDFNFVYAESNSLGVYTHSGDGDITMHQGGLTITAGGETITNGGLVVTAAGQTITAGGLTIQAGGASVKGGLKVNTGGQTVEAGGLTVTDGGTTLTTHSPTDTALHVFASSAKRGTKSAIMRIQANTNGTRDNPYDHNFNLIDTVIGTNTAPNITVFRVTGQPRTEVVTGGFEVKAGGATVATGGLVVSAGGLTLASGNLELPNGAMSTSGFSSSSITTFSAAVVVATGQTMTLDGATIEGGVTHIGLETFSGGITLAGTSSVTGGITFDGVTSITAALNTATSTATGLATFSGGVAVAGTSSVTGGITFDGVSSFTAAVNIDTMTATGVSSFTGALNTATSTATGLATFSGGVAVAGTSSVTGGITFDGTSSFTGALNVAAMTATGTSSFTGALNVDTSTAAGLATFSSGVAVAGTSSVTGGITFDGVTSITAALNTATSTATGLATFSGGVAVAGTSSVTGGITFDGVTSITAALNTATSTATGLATFSGGVAVAGTSSVTGGITFDGVTSITAALNTATSTATGLATFSGGVAVAGTSSVTGGITFDGVSS